MAIRSILSIQDLGDKSPLYAIEKLKYLISLGQMLIKKLVPIMHVHH